MAEESLETDRLEAAQTWSGSTARIAKWQKEINDLKVDSDRLARLHREANAVLCATVDINTPLRLIEIDSEAGRVVVVWRETPERTHIVEGVLERKQ